LFVNPFTTGKKVRLAYECSQDVLLIARVNGSNVQLTSRGKSASIEYTIPSGCESFGFFAWTFPCEYTLNAYSDTFKEIEDNSILSQDVANNIVKPLTRNLLDGFGNPSIFNNRYCKALNTYLVGIGASLSVKKENGTEFSRISIPTGCSISSKFSSINLFDINTTYDSDGYAECYVSVMVRNTASNSNLGFKLMTNNSWSSPNEILRNESNNFTLLRTHVTSSGTPGAQVNFKLRMYFSGGSTYTTTADVTFDFYNLSMSLVDVDKYQSIKISEPQAFEKRIMFLGDSITTESYYAPILRDLLHCTGYYNLAVIGATLCDKADQTPYDGNPSQGTPSQNVLGNQLQKILNNSTTYTANPPDIILIAIGTNDSGPNDSEDDINDIETYFTSDGGNTIVPCTPATFDSSDTYEQMRKHFAGAMRYVVSNLQVLFPNAKIFISTPIQAAVGTRYTRNIEVKQQLLSKLATRLSVTAIHTGEHCGIAQDFEYNGYFWDAGWATVSHPHNGRDLIDGIHPNSSGSNKMAKYIYSVIKNEFV
jgi:lysophospholipase L1-like esterase